VLYFGRRGIDALVGVFALLGFFYVPLGKHTGYEHVRAIFSTPAAQRAGRELSSAVLHIRDKLGSHPD
jgi:hypothetical protein